MKPLIERAMEYATVAHAEVNQYRNGYKLPYIVHPIEVMKRAATWGITDEEILSAFVLHDVVEDTKRTINHIKEEFGGRVASLVNQLTRPDEDGLSFAEKYSYLKKYVSKDINAIIGKIADRWANVMDYYSLKRKRKYAGKYALQCHPVYSAFINRKFEVINAHGKDVFNNIMETLLVIENVIRITYFSEYIVHETNMEKIERELKI